MRARRHSRAPFPRALTHRPRLLLAAEPAPATAVDGDVTVTLAINYGLDEGVLVAVGQHVRPAQPHSTFAARCHDIRCALSRGSSRCCCCEI
jgi:hypothetical protein